MNQLIGEQTGCPAAIRRARFAEQTLMALGRRPDWALGRRPDWRADLGGGAGLEGGYELGGRGTWRVGGPGIAVQVVDVVGGSGGLVGR